MSCVTLITVTELHFHFDCLIYICLNASRQAVLQLILEWVLTIHVYTTTWWVLRSILWPDLLSIHLRYGKSGGSGKTVQCAGSPEPLLFAYAIMSWIILPLFGGMAHMLECWPITDEFYLTTFLVPESCLISSLILLFSVLYTHKCHVRDYQHHNTFYFLVSAKLLLIWISVRPSYTIKICIWREKS